MPGLGFEIAIWRGVRHLCEGIIEKLLPELKLQPLDFVRVAISMNQIVKESK